jgi:hypothetical protein
VYGCESLGTDRAHVVTLSPERSDVTAAADAADPSRQQIAHDSGNKYFEARRNSAAPNLALGHDVFAHETRRQSPIKHSANRSSRVEPCRDSRQTRSEEAYFLTRGEGGNSLRTGRLEINEITRLSVQSIADQASWLLNGREVPIEGQQRQVNCRNLLKFFQTSAPTPPKAPTFVSRKARQSSADLRTRDLNERLLAPPRRIVTRTSGR